MQNQPDPKGCVCAKSLQSRPAPCDPPTVVSQAPLSMRFSRQEWSGLPGPLPGDLPDPGIEPPSLTSPAWQAGSLLLAPRGSPNRMDTFPLFHVILHGLFQVPLLSDQSSTSAWTTAPPFLAWEVLTQSVVTPSLL